MMSALEGAVDELEPIDLEQLDEQAKLRRRVDAKYVVPDQVAAADREEPSPRATGCSR